MNAISSSEKSFERVIQSFRNQYEPSVYRQLVLTETKFPQLRELYLPNLKISNSLLL